MKVLINRSQLLQYYIYINNHNYNFNESLKVLITIIIIFSLILIKFVGLNIKIIYAILLISMFFAGCIFLINAFSNIMEKFKCNICTNKIKKGDFYVIRDSVTDVLRLLGKNENDTQPILKVKFHNRNHWFYADKNQTINKGDEYYIILFKNGFYGHVFSGLLINPKIIKFFECNTYEFDYIHKDNPQQYWINGILDGKFIK